MSSEYRMKLRSHKPQQNENNNEVKKEIKMEVKMEDDPNDTLDYYAEAGDDGHASTPPSYQSSSLDDMNNEQDISAFFPPTPYGKVRTKVIGDRFIPQRTSDTVLEYQMQQDLIARLSSAKNGDNEESYQQALEYRKYQAYYRAEVLGDKHAADDFIAGESSSSPYTARRVYNFGYEQPITANNPYWNDHSSSLINPTDIYNAPIQLDTSTYTSIFNSPLEATRPQPQQLSNGGMRILNAYNRPIRHINKTAIKILDAPELQDDFYLNLVDWGSNDCLAVGLGTCVYLWDANTSRVTKLCDLQDEQITSVSWAQKQKGTNKNLLAIGTNQANLYLYDVKVSKKLRMWADHTGRIGSLCWNNNVLTTGSRDCTILHHDVRSSTEFFRELKGHNQEVCGLKWNQEGTSLASGGNDNKLIIWDSHQDHILNTFEDHIAAVKAISWSPWERGVLVSGGGTADKTIKFYNAFRGELIASHNIGSQVCNIQWSKRSKEIVSSHGYSNNNVSDSNQVIVWNAKNMHNIQPLAHLSGHTSRVLYMSMNDDGRTVVTGAGDETLRFWDVFDVPAQRRELDKTQYLR
ncbi:unnamed protein product [Cunninghamella blakesleeana]